MSGTQFQGERHVAEVVTKKSKITRKQAGAVILLVAAGVLVFIVVHGSQKKPEQTTYEKPLTIGTFERLPPMRDPAPKAVPASLVIPPLPKEAPPPLPASYPGQPPAGPQQAPAPPKLLIYSASDSAGAQAAPKPGLANPAMPGAIQAQESELGAALKPTELEGSTASVLPHPEMTITEGTMMPCVMDVALDSQLPGFVTCHLTQDVYGTTGSVKLLDRGTKITGEVRAGGNVRQGQNRVAILWRRAETPYHVVINLASPATDALGRSGVEGDVNNHFWARMGDALLFSLIESGGQIGSSALQAQGGVNMNFGGVGGAAQAALSTNANIPPTITVPQGATIAVMVARDLDFAKVYRIGLTSR